MLTRKVLISLRNKALRRMVWTKALNRLERILVDLTIRTVDKVKSARLEEVLNRILQKVTGALDTGVQAARARGREMATHAARLAVSWGNSEASKWRLDETFQFTLGMGVVLGLGR